MISSMSELPVHSPTLFLLNSFALSLLQHVDQVNLWSNCRKVQICLDACKSQSMIFINYKTFCAVWHSSTLQIAEKWKWGCINMWVTEYDHSQMQGGPVQFGIPLQRCNVNYLSMIFIHCKTFLHSLAFLLIDCFAHRGLCCSVPVQVWGLFLIISSGDDLTYR